MYNMTKDEHVPKYLPVCLHKCLFNSFLEENDLVHCSHLNVLLQRCC